MIRRTSFLYEDRAVDIDLGVEDGIAGLYAPRRRVLDTILSEAAAEAGAELRYGTGCSGLIHDAAGKVCGARLRGPGGVVQEARAPIVVGADGRRSAVARMVRAGLTRLARNSTAFVYQYHEGLPNLGYRWHFAPGAAGGIIPTNDGLSCVFVGVPPQSLTRARGEARPGFGALAGRHVPVLAEEIALADPVGTPIIFAGAPGYIRQSAGPGWALVGDAGYFRDPITAHGITDALRDAEILAEAIIAGRVADYPTRRDALSAEFFALTDRLAGLDWTMAEVQALHLDLTRAMKANQRWIQGQDRPVPRAA